VASHLTLGAVYAKYGLLDDAERELRAAANEAEDARTLLHRLQRDSR
jgi:hypothetical protein